MSYQIKMAYQDKPKQQFKIEVKTGTDPKWYSNAKRYDTMEEAEAAESGEIVDAIGLSGEIDLELNVGPPQLSLEALASRFLLKTSGLSLYQEDYLDRVGNANGGYDLGDLRAFVIANPGLPTSGSSQSGIQKIDLVVGVPDPGKPTAHEERDPARSVDGKGGAR